MRFAGIDVGSQTHVLAIVDETCQVLLRPTPFGEDAAGYDRLFGLLGSPADVLVAMEATGHYGQNLFATLTQKTFAAAIINPLRTHHFAQEELRRASNDSIDALSIARFAAQKHPPASPPRDRALTELRQLVRLHGRLTQDFGDRVRQLYRSVNLGFPEFTRHVHGLDARRASAILREYPTAEAFHPSCVRTLAKLRYDGQHTVGRQLAQTLIGAARVSVGRHHGPAFATEVRFLCEDLDNLRPKIRGLESDIERAVRAHPIASLLTTITGIGPLTAAHIVATVGDPARFRHAATFAAYVGVVPGTSHSGLWRPGQAPLCRIGHARLRKALWMPTLVAVKHNPWLRDYYQRLREKGKKPKVALVAAMRKLLTAVYSVAKHQRPFHVKTQ